MQSTVVSEVITDIENGRLLDVDILTSPNTTSVIIKNWNKTHTMKGFRPGKVPKPVIENFVGENSLYMQEMIDSYHFIKNDRGYYTTNDPDLVEWKEQTDGSLKFKIKVNLLKDFDVNSEDYLGVEVPKPAINSEKAEHAYEEFLKSTARQLGTFKPADRLAQPLDYLTVSSIGSIDGEPSDAWTWQSKVIHLDEKILGHEFYQALLNANVDEKTVCESSSIPDPNLTGKIITLEFTVEEVKELIPHEINDEMAALTPLGVSTLQELREKCIADYNKTQQEILDKRFEFASMEAVLNKINLEIPESMITNELSSLLRYRIQMFENFGLTKNDALKNTDFDLMRLQAKNRISAALIFDKLFRKNVFKYEDVTEADVATKIAKKAEEYDKKEEDVKKEYSSPEALLLLKKEILYDRFVSQVNENAKAVISGPALPEPTADHTEPAVHNNECESAE